MIKKKNIEPEKNIAIHIGYHKSASTYLQEKVFTVMKAHYIFLAGEDREILDMVQSESRFDKKKLYNWIERELTKLPDDNSKKTTILSHEELSGHPHGYTDKINPFVVADNLKKAFPDAKILIVTRNQFDYLLSLYTFRVAIRGYEYRSINRFIEEEGEKGLLDKLEYHRLVDYYISLFSADNVHVIPMELLKSDPVLFHEKIGSFVNTECPIPDYRPIVNKSTKLKAVLTFWRIGNFFFALFLNLLKGLRVKTDPRSPYFTIRYRYFKFKKIITNVLNKLFFFSGKIDMHSYKHFDTLNKRLAKTNMELQKHIQFNLKKLDYPLPDKE